MPTSARCTVCGVLTLAAAAAAQNVQQGWIASPYAIATDAFLLSFSEDGVLFTGNENNAQPGVRIWRIGAGGSPVTAWGDRVISDPDAVLFDPAGVISGVPGSVLVGSGRVGGTGAIEVIRPDQTTFTRWTSTVFTNPSEMAFDSTGRMLFLDLNARRVFATTGGQPVPISSTFSTFPSHLALDAADRLYVSQDSGNVSQLAPDGSPINPTFAVFQNRAALAFARGSIFPAGLYALERPTGNLYRLDESGVRTPVGEGFSTAQAFDIAFGPDGLLYISSVETDRILRVHPCTPNCDGNAVLDIFDYLCFLNEFQANTVYTCNCDTSSGPAVCDIFDFLCFQNAFAAGCP